MPLKVAVQMDPIHAIDINADSSFALMMEAQGRGHELFYYLPQELAWSQGQVKARVRSVSLRRKLVTMRPWEKIKSSTCSPWMSSCCARIRPMTCPI